MECYWDPTRSVSYFAIPLEEHHHDLAAMLVLYVGELLKRCASLNRLEIKRNKEKTRNNNNPPKVYLIFMQELHT
jgi:hypothetical protein